MRSESGCGWKGQRGLGHAHAAAMLGFSFLGLLLVACGGETFQGAQGDVVDGGTGGEEASGSGGASAAGGRSGPGGRGSGGGGTSGGAGSMGGGPSTGGRSAAGGAAGAGGTQGNSGGSNGGALGSGGAQSAGGASSGGAMGPGGAQSAGGASIGGFVGSGGIQSAGGTSSGGFVSSGGAQGTGGSPVQCDPGALECDAHRRCGQDGRWADYQCGPLTTADVTDMNSQGLTQFASAGFRCRTVTACGNLQTCIYYLGFLGNLQSGEERYYDGDELIAAQAVKIRVAGGAASPAQCLSPNVTFVAGDYLTLKLGSDRTLNVAFPAFVGQELTLYVREDGATFYDAALTQRAG